MSFKRTINGIRLTLRKHSPEILGAVGTVAIIGGAIWACKATVDSADKIKETEADVKEIKQSVKDEIISKKEGTKKVIAARVNCVKSVGVKFVGPVIVIGVGLYFQHKGRSIVNKRLNGVVTAYTALESRYKLLEDNVRREYGEEELNRLKYGTRSDTAIVRRIDENGIETEHVENFDGVIDLSRVRPFTLVWDHKSGRHHTDVIHCEAELETAEKILTEQLQRRGILWLDDVMHQLDIQPRDAQEAMLARVICWTYNPNGKDNDNCVRLRWKRLYDESTKNFDAGYNPIYILDPNYDTNINQEWYKYMR